MKAAADHFLYRNIATSANERFRMTARCHPSRPRSSISWMWRSRWVGAVSAVSLGTAVDLGGMITAASGVCPATER